MEHPYLNVCVNRAGRYYDNGRRYPQILREEVLDMNHNGASQREIARELKTSRCFVQHVLSHYEHTNSSIARPKSQPPKTTVTLDVINCIEMEKAMKPSTHLVEIQDRLILDGVVHPMHLPSKSAISKCIREDLNMTKKRIQQVPVESERPENIELTNEFLEKISDLPPGTVHCFDESSVIKMTSNRKYGNSSFGEPAIEVQRYASNATYTVNLLHSPLGIDHINVLGGPSNGQELLLFFEDAVNLTRVDGSVVLERGDSVVMDNC